MEILSQIFKHSSSKSANALDDYIVAKRKNKQVANNSSFNPTNHGVFEKQLVNLTPTTRDKNYTTPKRIGTKEISDLQRNRIYITSNNGFTLTETLIVTLLVGILSSVALPNYLNQLNRTRQDEASSSIAQLQNAIVAFADENGVYPTSWKDLNEVAAIMTPSGVTSQNNFKKMTLASNGCEQKDQNNCYTVEAIHANQDSLYTLSALPVDTSRKNYNIVACLDLISGSSDFKKGNHLGAAEISNLNCSS